MKRQVLLLAISSALFLHQDVSSHCQMPCGIYHDDMVYDQIDQYVETMFKGISVLNENKFDTVKAKNEFVRWVMLKEDASEEVANILTTFFLQQKIKPGEPDTDARLRSAHKLLFLTVQIKQNSDTQFVNEFTDEWDRFKLMFHVENYECQIEQIKQIKRDKMKEELSKKDQAASAKSDTDHSHDDHGHDHDHPHPH